MGLFNADESHGRIRIRKDYHRKEKQKDTKHPRRLTWIPKMAIFEKEMRVVTFVGSNLRNG